MTGQESRPERAWRRVSTWTLAAASHVYDGSQILAERTLGSLADWIAQGEDRADRAMRLALPLVGLAVPLGLAVRPHTGAGWSALLALLALILFALRVNALLGILLATGLVATYAPWLAWPAAALWCWRAYRELVPAKPRQPRQKKPRRSSSGEAPQSAPQSPGGTPHGPAHEHLPDTPERPHEDPRVPFVWWLLNLIGQANGIHLRDLYPEMRQLPGQAGLSDTDLRARLDTLGIPVQRSLTVGKAEGRTGVRRADLERYLDHLAQGTPYPDESEAA